MHLHRYPDDDGPVAKRDFALVWLRLIRGQHDRHGKSPTEVEAIELDETVDRHPSNIRDVS
jgi:hypothetical protein